MRQSKPVLLLISLAIFFLPTTARAQTILLVRHAEKVSNAPDAALSDIGNTRAKKLALMLADAGISAIYTSEVQRTLQTAAPLAKQLKIAPTVIAAKDMDGLVSKLIALPDEAVVLVVGHSNTLPEIIRQLLGERKIFDGIVPPTRMIGDSDYDRFFIVSRLRPDLLVRGVRVPGTAIAKLLVLHY